MRARATDRSEVSTALPLAAAAASLLLCVLLAGGDPLRTLSSYLFAWLFFLALSLGSMGALMLHQLTGGRWGTLLQRYFMAALAPLPILALLFTPVALGLVHLFPWVVDCCGGSDSSRFRAAYLTRGAFLMRSGIAIVAWLTLTRLLRTRIVAGRRSMVFCAAGLLIYLLTMSWGAVDWIASLEPKWASSVLGLSVVMAQALAAFALATVYATRASSRANAPGAAECGDLGNLLFTFSMTWMYLAFVEFLTIWAEDLPRETSWYFPRVQGRWDLLTAVVVAGQFAVPFALLLFRRLKCDANWLGRLALLVLASSWLYWAWLILPTTQPNGPPLAVSDLAATAGIGGLWYFAFRRALDTVTRDLPAPEPVESRGSSPPQAEQAHGS